MKKPLRSFLVDPKRGPECTTCKHPRRAEIDELLREGRGGRLVAAALAASGDFSLTGQRIQSHKGAGHHVKAVA